MRDQYGRELNDLRISLTDRCNLRCVYCMPEEGIDFRPPEELLRDDELLLLVRIAAELGVKRVRLTGGGRVERVLAGIARAEAVGLLPMKINAVVVRGFNEEDVVSLARLTLERPWEVRFIEVMPFGAVADVADAGIVTSEETMARIEAALGPLEAIDLSGGDPARTYRARAAAGTLGFISPVSQPFCSKCGRLRLTADGRLRLCLLRDDEVDLLT